MAIKRLGKNKANGNKNDEKKPNPESSLYVLNKISMKKARNEETKYPKKYSQKVNREILP